MSLYAIICPQSFYNLYIFLSLIFYMDISFHLSNRLIITILQPSFIFLLNFLSYIESHHDI